MSTTCWGSPVSVAERKPVALLARAGAARDRLREALEAAFNAGLEQGRNANPSDKANT